MHLMKLKSHLKFLFGVGLCVILPMSIYVMDVLITVNVIEAKNYKEAMNHWQDETNQNNLPIPRMSTFNIPDSYSNKETWFYEVRLF